MNDPAPELVTLPKRRLRFEIIFASAWLGFGLFLLPAAIYAVGAALLGGYGAPGTSAGLGKFYVDYFADLAEPSGRVWALALGPLVIISLIRLIFIGSRRADATVVNAPPNEEEDDDEPKRVEPRITLD
jgi:hypothetical protein